MAINAQNRSLPDWFTRIRTRQIVLPRFQRIEAWTHGDIKQMFNTILQGLPIGAVLVLEIGNEEPFVSRTIRGAPGDGDRITEHLLDGQQRLTGLWRGLHNNYEDRTYFLYLSEDEETGMSYYVDSIARWRRGDDTEMRPFYANKPKEQWRRHMMIPLDLCAPGDNQPRNFRKWAKKAIIDRDERDEIVDKVTEIRQKFVTFNLPFLSLPVSTPKATALDVFIKMNTSAAQLSIYDIVVAQVEAAMGQSLHDLVSEIRSTCPSVAEYYPPENLALYAGALMQGRPPTNATYLNTDFGDGLLENWEQYIKGVSRAVTFLEEERVFDAARLPTDVVVPVLVALWALVPEGGDAEGQARTILRRYLWRAFFSTRYERSSNSRAHTDFNELRPLVTGLGGDSNPVIFNNDQHPLPDQKELIATSWPKKNDRLARAILALALNSGGLDLADGSIVSRTNLAKREYHHLFPVAYLRRCDIEDNRIDCSLNCALVTWHTNRTISDKKPKRYMRERLEGTGLNKSEIRTRLNSHLIPYKQMISEDYDEFLSARARKIHKEMIRICNGGTA